VPKNSHPVIAVVSRSPRFFAEVNDWPHGSFEVEPAEIAKSANALCIGPDIPNDEVTSWRARFPDAKIVIWVKDVWDLVSLLAIEKSWLSGLSLIELKDRRTLPEIWSRALRASDEREDVLEELSKKALKSSSDQLESLMSFIKAIGSVNSVFELLGHLRSEMQSYKVVGDPILLLSKAKSLSQLFYFRGNETHVRQVEGAPSNSLRVRIHDSFDRQFLANQLGRPFGKVIAFPLAQERSSGWQIQPFIFFEHRMEDLELPRFIDNVGQRLQAVSLSLDRLVLETEMKRASALWEKTFDGIEEPIAIVGLGGDLVRTNRHFVERDLTGLETGLLKSKDSIYKVDRYDIRIRDRGPVLSTVVHYHDVTKPMNLRERMIQLEKMSAIGHLAGHIAHELNNPLTGIRSLAQILITETSGRLREDLQEVETAAQRCQEIILNLLDFSKGQLDSKTIVCDLNEIVAKTLPFLKSALGRYSSDIKLFEEPLFVEVEPHLMQQVVFNLVNNSCQALENTSGIIEVSTSQEVIKSDVFSVLAISDNGPGVPEDLQQKIFEPFFTTKNEGQGTGLGLSFSRDFVRKLGGDIVCLSKQGGGVIFKVLLPLARSKSEAS
jgi:signal transduction histidine kinase